MSTHDKIYKVVGKFLSKAICPIPVPPNVIVHPVAWFCATSIILPTGFHKYLHASENISKFLRNLLQGHIFGASICLVFYHFKLAHSRGTTICAQVISDFSICQGQRLCFSCFYIIQVKMSQNCVKIFPKATESTRGVQWPKILTRDYDQDFGTSPANVLSQNCQF